MNRLLFLSEVYKCGWLDDSVGKVLDTQALRGPSWNPQNACTKSGVMVHAWNPSAEKGRDRISEAGLLASSLPECARPRWSRDLAPEVRYEQLRKTLHADLWPPCTHVHTQSCTGKVPGWFTCHLAAATMHVCVFFLLMLTLTLAVSQVLLLSALRIRKLRYRKVTCSQLQTLTPRKWTKHLWIKGHCSVHSFTSITCWRTCPYNLRS